MSSFASLTRTRAEIRRLILPNLKSAKKRVRQTDKRYVNNSNKKAAIRTAEKKIRSLAGENKLDEANKVYREYTSLIDRAAKTNTVHKNAAARKKARLSKLISQKPA